MVDVKVKRITAWDNINGLTLKPCGGGVIFWPLFLLAVTPLVLATPVHATDDNTVSIAVDQNAALQPTGTLYKATTNVTVKTSKPYGFNLTMQADTAALVNTKDSTHKISATPSTTPVTLNANQWGYSLSKSATTFSAVPAGAQATPAVVADVTKAKKPAGCINLASYTKSVTFAAKVDSKIASGNYSTKIIYTVTAKPKPIFIDWDKRTAKTDPSDICRSGDKNSSCLVDLDRNMIPVKYTGTTTNAQWTSISNPEDECANGNWYDYSKKRWANAVTVRKEALAKYQGEDEVIDQADILGYWVYIPRYAYEVMRRDGTDKPVKAQNFDIKFENTKTPKKRPLACKTGNGKDYRAECGVSRELPLAGGEVSTWATHPAFTFGNKEFNGIWFAKFETTGSFSAPTVKPNLQHITGDAFYNNYRQIGGFYTSAKSIGVADENNSGGMTPEGENEGDAPEPNSHHLNSYNSRFINNKDWGAAAYLSASEYGAGASGVHNNGQIDDRGNAYGSHGITGCGPYNEHDDGSYANANAQIFPKHTGVAVGKFGTQAACSADNLQRAYNGTIGQLASTTNNPTGIYDMAGGAAEYTAARYSQTLDGADDSLIGYTVRPPYVNLYNFTNFNACTFETCGGQALYETTGVDKVKGARWNNDYAMFVGKNYPWFERGGDATNGPGAGVFATYAGAGYAQFRFAFRVVLGSFAQQGGRF